MTTKEFLDKYDNNETFTEEEMFRIWIGDTEIEMEVIEEGIGEQYRWNHIEWQVVKINNRYFDLAIMAGNTEYQDNEYYIQPQEVKPVETVITKWERVD